MRPVVVDRKGWWRRWQLEPSECPFDPPKRWHERVAWWLAGTVLIASTLTGSILLLFRADDAWRDWRAARAKDAQRELVVRPAAKTSEEIQEALRRDWNKQLKFELSSGVLSLGAAAVLLFGLRASNARLTACTFAANAGGATLALCWGGGMAVAATTRIRHRPPPQQKTVTPSRSSL